MSPVVVHALFQTQLSRRLPLAAKFGADKQVVLCSLGNVELIVVSCRQMAVPVSTVKSLDSRHSYFPNTKFTIRRNAAPKSASLTSPGVGVGPGTGTGSGSEL